MLYSGGGPHLPPRRKDDPVVPARPPPTPDRSSVGSANGIFRTAIGEFHFLNCLSEVETVY